MMLVLNVSNDSKYRISIHNTSMVPGRPEVVAPHIRTEIGIFLEYPPRKDAFEHIHSTGQLVRIQPQQQVNVVWHDHARYQVVTFVRRDLVNQGCCLRPNRIEEYRLSPIR
jgi:hypothetical protein